MTRKTELARQLVTRVLMQHPETRNSDVELHIHCLEEQGVALSYYQKAAIRRAFDFETVRRIRQKIQESGLFMPDEKTARGRKMKEARMREEMKRKPKYRYEFVKEVDPITRNVTEYYKQIPIE